MAKTKREIMEDLKLIDVVIEIIDARMPISSRNPDIQKMIKNKNHIILLNKSDLAEEMENKKWIEFFKTQNSVAIEVDCNLGKGMKNVLLAIYKIMEDDLKKAFEKGRVKKNIRVIIVGIPNVGKSSFINRICNKKATIVGNRPGVTKQKQWIKISDNIELLDTPGVLWPKFEDKKIGLNLAYAGSIKDEIMDTTEIAYQLLKYLNKNYKNNLLERYKLTNEEINNIISDSEDEILSLMELMAKKRGAIISGGNIDYDRISNIILNDFRTGKIGRITLEKLNG